jgi:ferredoxin
MNFFVDSAAVIPESERIGFVFPIHGFGLPHIAANFIRKLDLASIKYVFAVATRGGSPTNALKDVESLLKKKGKRLNSFFCVNMPNNSYFIHDLNTQEEMNGKLKNAAADVAKIVNEINNGGNRKDKDHELNFANSAMFMILHSFFNSTRYLGFENAFYVDSTCTGCRICESVCPSGKIKLVDKRPSWQKQTRCHVCLACVSYCPIKAVHNGKLKVPQTCPDGRYHNPYVTTDQISEQKKVILWNDHQSTPSPSLARGSAFRRAARGHGKRLFLAAKKGGWRVPPSARIRMRFGR